MLCFAFQVKKHILVQHMKGEKVEKEEKKGPIHQKSKTD